MFEMRIIKLGIKRRRKMLTARLNGNVLRVDLKRLKRFVSALLPPGSAQTQHTSPNAAAAAAAVVITPRLRPEGNLERGRAATRGVVYDH